MPRTDRNLDHLTRGQRRRMPALELDPAPAQLAIKDLVSGVEMPVRVASWWVVDAVDPQPVR